MPSGLRRRKSDRTFRRRDIRKGREDTCGTGKLKHRLPKNLGAFSPYLFGIQGLRLSASDPNVRESGFRLITTHAPAFSPLSVNGYDSDKLDDMDATLKRS